MRFIFLILHVVSAGVWIGQFAAWMGFRLAKRGAEGKPVELPLLMAEVRVLSLMGNIGGIGIIITGMGLIGTDGWGFLGIGQFTPSWLIIKQVVYLVTLALAFGVIVPAQRKMRPLFVEAAKGTPKVTPEIRALHARAQMASHAVNALVLANIVLAVVKMPV